MIAVQRRDDEPLRLDMDLQFEAADVTAISVADLRDRIEFVMRNDGLASGTVPRHGKQFRAKSIFDSTR
jgi:hypothetical protein